MKSLVASLTLVAITCLGLASTLVSATAAAQSATTGLDEISFYLGEQLPTGIDGVTEILPVFGGRYGFATSRIGIAELGLSNTHAKGVDFTTLEASLRGTVPVSAGLEGFFYGGLDFNYYIPENETDRRSATGLHVGAGAMMALTDTLWLRGDIKFMGGPGSNLYLLFGIVFR